MFRKLWRVIDSHTRLFEKQNKRINKAEWKITDVIDALLTVSSIALSADDQDVVRDKLSRKYTGDELHQPVDQRTKPVTL